MTLSLSGLLPAGSKLSKSSSLEPLAKKLAYRQATLRQGHAVPRNELRGPQLGSYAVMMKIVENQLSQSNSHVMSDNETRNPCAMRPIMLLSPLVLSLST